MRPYTHRIKLLLLLMIMCGYVATSGLTYTNGGTMQRGDIFRIRASNGQNIAIQQNRDVVLTWASGSEFRASVMGIPDTRVYIKDINDNGQFSQNVRDFETFTYHHGISRSFYNMIRPVNNGWIVSYDFNSGIVTHSFCWILKDQRIFTESYTNSIGFPDYTKCNRFSFSLVRR
ncbi:hypothetical protein BDF14DRAFT_1844832 [Spinellus fusiger]|nr:hypothetical protein BDF14DRAFT_1844832 [Spinellus fusiger]